MGNAIEAAKRARPILNDKDDSDRPARRSSRVTARADGEESQPADASKEGGADAVA